MKKQVLLSIVALMALVLGFVGLVDSAWAQDPDTDGDGYADSVDWCPEDGDWGLGLDEFGCPIWDTDSDGVFDADDWCPEQGDAGNGIDESGCPLGVGDSAYEYAGSAYCSITCSRATRGWGVEEQKASQAG